MKTMRIKTNDNSNTVIIIMDVFLHTNQEDDSIQPMVTQDESNEEEWDSKKHGHTSNEVDEMVNFLCNGCFTGI